MSGTRTGVYDYRQIEARWRRRWLTERTFRTQGPGEEGFDPRRPKCYVLDMFPYPSGSGLHIGHPKGYIASDIYNRYKRMQGYNVLHPMGFDSFGLPAEQYAIEHNVHPAVTTERNIDTIRGQLEFLGLAYDWDREIASSRPDYYRWTQWIFLRLFGSWFDPDHTWEDAAGRPIRGRARPVSELVRALDSGARRLTPAERQAMAGQDWHELPPAGKDAVLNGYRLAYQEEVTVNWCPGLGTVLANEEVTNEGKSERGNYPVYRRPLRQWIMRITAYAERLLEDLDSPSLPDGRGGTFGLQWPEPVKLMQRNWIGRSEGAEVDFAVLRPGTEEPAGTLRVFTTRPDTLFGATFMVIAPEHPLVDPESDSYLVPASWPAGTDERWRGTRPQLDVRHAVAAYREAASLDMAVNREEKEKTGVFAGIWARNPVNGELLPVFVADYVSMEYGSGAIMAVPAHDERDYDFARQYGLPIVQVVQPPHGVQEGCFSGEGTAVNSAAAGESPFAITGLPTAAAKGRITAALEEAALGQRAVNYRLRDWIFSRQRYWGEPFPLARRQDGVTVGVEPPVLLPAMEDFRPETSDDPDRPVSPPLGRAPEEWRRLTVDGKPAERELNVMPQWAGSCWYYLRFIDPHNDHSFCAAEKQRYFMPVDLYIGGAEHAVLHLLYSRFWHKVLFDLGHVDTPEPFLRLFNQGMITADAFQDERGVYVDIRQVEMRDGEPYLTGTDKKLLRSAGKMGKRYKNGLPPEEVGEEYGVDTLRLYEMYMGPLEASTPWSMEGIRGMQRFLQRVWRNLVSADSGLRLGGSMTPQLHRLMHRTIQRVTEDLEGLRFNTAIAALIELNNELVGLDRLPEELARNLLLLLAPMAPHLAEEVWSRAGFGDGNISTQPWPQADAAALAQETIVLPVQVNGKVRGSVQVPVGVDEETLRQRVLEVENVRRFVPDPARIRRFVVVPGKIVNLVVAG
ncbi:MAG: class I tRNA ligase family protein [Candidatus Latescibacterota bacterium]